MHHALQCYSAALSSRAPRPVWADPRELPTVPVVERRVLDIQGANLFASPLIVCRTGAVPMPAAMAAACNRAWALPAASAGGRIRIARAEAANVRVERLETEHAGARVDVPRLRPANNVVVAVRIVLGPRRCRDVGPVRTQEGCELGQRAHGLHRVPRAEERLPVSEQRARSRAWLAQHTHLGLMRRQHARRVPIRRHVVEEAPLSAAGSRCEGLCHVLRTRLTYSRVHRHARTASAAGRWGEHELRCVAT